MATTTAPPQLPKKLGECRYCPPGQGALYENAPIVRFPDGTIAHVACEIDARRQNRGG